MTYFLSALFGLYFFQAIESLLRRQLGDWKPPPLVKKGGNSNATGPKCAPAISKIVQSLAYFPAGCVRRRWKRRPPSAHPARSTRLPPRDRAGEEVAALETAPRQLFVFKFKSLVNSN